MAQPHCALRVQLIVQLAGLMMVQESNALTKLIYALKSTLTMEQARSVSPIHKSVQITTLVIPLEQAV